MIPTQYADIITIVKLFIITVKPTSCGLFLLLFLDIPYLHCMLNQQYKTEDVIKEPLDCFKYFIYCILSAQPFSLLTVIFQSKKYR